jgi:hypothetical protein
MNGKGKDKELVIMLNKMSKECKFNQMGKEMIEEELLKVWFRYRNVSEPGGMMNLLEWLESPIGRIRAVDKKEMNIKMRLSELVGVNYGKIEITQVGKIEPGGPYGRLGLTLEEAFELATMMGCYSGFILALDDDESREVMKKAFHLKDSDVKLMKIFHWLKVKQ